APRMDRGRRRTGPRAGPGQRRGAVVRRAGPRPRPGTAQQRRPVPAPGLTMVQLRPAAPGNGNGPRHLKDALRRWAPTPAFGRVVLVVGALLAAAMLFGRADLVVLAAPFAVGGALG